MAPITDPVKPNQSSLIRGIAVVIRSANAIANISEPIAKVPSSKTGFFIYSPFGDSASIKSWCGKTCALTKPVERPGVPGAYILVAWHAPPRAAEVRRHEHKSRWAIYGGRVIGAYPRKAPGNAPRKPPARRTLPNACSGRNRWKKTSAARRSHRRPSGSVSMAAMAGLRSNAIDVRPAPASRSTRSGDRAIGRFGSLRQR